MLNKLKNAIKKKKLCFNVDSSKTNIKVLNLLLAKRIITTYGIDIIQNNKYKQLTVYINYGFFFSSPLIAISNYLR